MAEQSLAGALRRVLNVAAVQALAGLSDGELLGLFVGSHDEAAFTALVERHGPMVLGVCRRALANRHDAEDACQAAFLVLARKAASLGGCASVGAWLHGVAGRVAASLKRGAARRARRERVAVPVAPADPAKEATWREVQAALDEELGRLPERYRAPLILCYLECLARDEAAARLGISPGALHGRLERGRQLLRDRLTRRGLTLSAAVTAMALGESTAQAALPATLVVSATRAAALFAAGQPISETVGANVIALTREVLMSMSLTKVKAYTAAVLCAAVFAALVGGSLLPRGSAQYSSSESAFRNYLAPQKTESDEEFIRRLSKDLRGTEPTPIEVHFFVASKEADKRDKLIDLLIQERQAKKQPKAEDKRPAKRDAIPSPDDKAPAARDLLEEARKREEILKQQRDQEAKRAKQMPPAGLNGVVEKLDKGGKLMVISIGSDEGLAKGHMLHIYRLKPKAIHLGKVKIVDVSPKTAVAEYMDRLPAETHLQVGDTVASETKP